MADFTRAERHRVRGGRTTSATIPTICRGHASASFQRTRRLEPSLGNLTAVVEGRGRAIAVASRRRPRRDTVLPKDRVNATLQHREPGAGSRRRWRSPSDDQEGVRSPAVLLVGAVGVHGTVGGASRRDPCPATVTTSTSWPAISISTTCPSLRSRPKGALRTTGIRQQVLAQGGGCPGRGSDGGLQRCSGRRSGNAVLPQRHQLIPTVAVRARASEVYER
jgi:hypothetical protein